MVYHVLQGESKNSAKETTVRECGERSVSTGDRKYCFHYQPRPDDAV
jgi:hypothetical protein